jgi:hypothetical protein
MKIENFLGDGNKLQSLIEMKSLISKEIYKYCLFAAIDPESFNYQQFLLEHKDNINSMIIKYYPELVTYCEKLDYVDKKIEEISAN